MGEKQRFSTACYCWQLHQMPMPCQQSLAGSVIRTMRLLLPILCAFSLATLTAAQQAQAPSAPLRIVLVGDSTVASVPNPPQDRPTLAGWGQVLGHYLTPGVEVINHARSGTSTKSFLSSGLWTKALASQPNYVFIQFGHNDQPGKGDRTTDPNGDYQENLRRFITETRAAGATPVLVTSVTRRTFTEGKLASTLTDYVEAVKKVGRETKTPVIDLHRASFALVDQMGEKATMDFAPSATDRTHFSHKGALMMARLVAEGIAREVPILKDKVQLVTPLPPNTPFRVQLDTLSRGYDGKTCWVHPRAGAIPGTTPSVVMTMQKLLLTGSDIFYALNDLRTDDLGKTWSPITEHHNTLGRRTEPDGVIVAACDFTPKWHAKSGKLLGIGHTVRYEGDKVMENRKREASYAVYDQKTRQWSAWTTLAMPNDPKFFNSGAGCVQRFDLENGDILLPIYFKAKEDKFYRVTILRCTFDGTTLRMLEQGNDLALESGRGVYEPSLTRVRGRFYLTLRNDTAGYVCTSDDGLHFTSPKKWTWDDDGAEIGNYNTQQHWVTHDDTLYLVYTRKGANNDHVFRHRAPLFMAEVDPLKLTIKRATECILVPERGARLGNFAICEVSEKETWVTVAEWMQTWGPNIVIKPDNAFGSDNSVYAARILWNKK
jgi:lysophospholipase L1-like esterase